MRLQRIICPITLLLIAGLAFTGCLNPNPPTSDSTPPSPSSPARSAQPSETPGKEEESQGKMRVLTTISVLTDLVNQVGAERVLATSIIPAGSDPHSFQPTPQDVRQIARAHVVFMNGAGLEGALENLIRRAGTPDTRVVVLSEGLEALREEQPEEQSHPGEDEHPDGNPHFWLDVRFAKLYVQKIQRALTEVDPAGAAEYQANANRYLAELEDLDAWIERQIGEIPMDRRKLVTFHDAFPYYARRYGLDLVGVVLRNPGQEPSAKDIAQLVDALRREKVRTVFAEPQFNARVLEMAAKEVGIKVATLYSDATDEKMTTYAAMMRHNTEQIVNSLR